MRKRTLTIAAFLSVLLLAVTTAAHARERAEGARRRGLKALGFKVYWSLLDGDQKVQARRIIGDHLAETASDRLESLALLVQYKSDVVDVLTPEQIRAAVAMKRRTSQLGADDRRALADRLLAGTDREALARRAEQHSQAAPADKVRLGFEMLDQIYEVVEPELAERLTLSAEQRARIRALYDGLKRDVEPLALRVEAAKAQSAAAAIALLDEDQRARLERFKETITEKVLAFLRG